MTLAHLEHFPSNDGKFSFSRETLGHNGDVYYTEITAVRVGVIGHAMILTGRYDPDQGWLAFMHGAIINQAPPSEEERENIERWRSIAVYQQQRDHARQMEQVRAKLAAPIRVPHQNARVFDYSNRRQHQLPFWEARACKDDWEYRDASGLWEKASLGETVADEDGEEWEEEDKPLTLSLSEPAEKWCEASCEGRYFIDGRNQTIFFERYHDLFHCRVATGGMPG